MEKCFLTDSGYITDGSQTTGYSFMDIKGFYHIFFQGELKSLLRGNDEMSCLLRKDEQVTLPLLFILGESYG